MADTEALADLLAERDRLRAENEELKREVHNLNWALSTPGYEEMATPEDQAEHEAGMARITANINAMTECGKRFAALVPEGADVLDVLEQARADVRELADALQTAIWRLDDMLRGDDGQAWKEAERAMPPLRALLAKHNPLQALADNAREMGLSYEEPT